MFQSLAYPHFQLLLSSRSLAALNNMQDAACLLRKFSPFSDYIMFFCIASDEKLGGAWEHVVLGQVFLPSGQDVPHQFF